MPLPPWLPILSETGMPPPPSITAPPVWLTVPTPPKSPTCRAVPTVIVPPLMLRAELGAEVAPLPTARKELLIAVVPLVWATTPPTAMNCPACDRASVNRKCVGARLD